jgi:hypothetical protein
MADENPTGGRIIKEICNTEVPVYSSGIFTTKSSFGAKIKTSSTGTIEVQYCGDDEGTWRDLTIVEPHVWHPDRIVAIRESGTNISESNILIGY